MSEVEERFSEIYEKLVNFVEEDCNRLSAGEVLYNVLKEAGLLRTALSWIEYWAIYESLVHIWITSTPLKMSVVT